MNKARRKMISDAQAVATRAKEALQGALDKLESGTPWADVLKESGFRVALDDASDVAGEFSSAGEEEQEYHDNMPEGLQSGEKGAAAEEQAQELERRSSGIEDALSGEPAEDADVEIAKTWLSPLIAALEEAEEHDAG